MRAVLILIMLGMCIMSFGQSLEKREVVGKWITEDLVIDFGNTKSKDENVLKELKKGFLKSEFDFRENGKFYIKFPYDQPFFMKELVFLNDKNWKVEQNQIKIGTPEDEYTLMHILFKRVKGKTYFIIPGMKLEMKRE
ncbi:hypothetical protein [Aquimarina rhabdastrellae]